MTTVLLHTGQTAPKIQTPRPRVQVVRGGRHGLNRARQLAASTVLVLAAALLLGLIVSVVYSQARSPSSTARSTRPKATWRPPKAITTTLPPR